ncbi:MAG: archaemetzincin family Zn-dependent metalloprotease [Thermoproteus sp.]
MIRVLVFSEVEIGQSVVEVVASSFRGLVEVRAERVDLTPLKAQALDASRMQIRADRLLELLGPTGAGRQRRVYVVDADGYVPGLNFVFGAAYGDKAVVFTKRLDPSSPLFDIRLAKEIIHELGHTLGLGHCRNPRCIMYFSNTIIDTDLKGPGFCDKCFEKLRRSVEI